MKFQFKIQPYQTDAVNSVVGIFKNQPKITNNDYIRDLGIKKKVQPQHEQMAFDGSSMITNGQEPESNVGFSNAAIQTDIVDILDNIRETQTRGNIKLSDCLIGNLGACSLDVEMETGTGKTYVYIKTIFELNAKYGWSKFIVVVPSVAIREGVKKSFEMTEEHFMEHYGKKIRYFIYNSKNLSELDDFSSSPAINVMIINMQAFNARGADARRIYDKIDDFGSRRPIDVIKKNNPIIILDEPQKMGGTATQESLKEFNPLFTLNYSATHAKQNNLVYVLDALDAYNNRLVKKIEVKGFEVKNFRGTDKYLYLESILVSPSKPPRAKIELEINYKKSINREARILGVDDNLYITSNEMEQYKEGFVIKEIDPIGASVTFTNGITIQRGDIVGDVSESDLRRIQIRETILSHFEKEEQLFGMGIKTLSLFFIDEVAKYRVYDENGDEMNSEYAKIFEQEYTDILNQYITLEDTPYIQYLKKFAAHEVHKGYFSIDKKSGRVENSKTKRNSDESDDISAYDLILKNKERLLSFDEPTRFIFSHSALREGWDNPNVFQICTLKHSDSSTGKRQEVGRGLRLCVNSSGTRMDKETLGENIHNINKLTVIASESYAGFVSDLQKQIKEVLYDRPSKATVDYFQGKTILVNDEPTLITARQARDIYRYLLKNDYIDNDDNVAPEYRAALANGTLAPLPVELVHLTTGIHMLVQSIFDESVLNDMIGNGNETKITENPLNDNFYKKEFQTLWGYINHKYAYTVDFDSAELIKKSIAHIDEKLFVSELQYTRTVSEQKTDLDQESIGRGDSFKATKTKTETLKHAQSSQIKYDLLGKIAYGTSLTRSTITAILSGIGVQKFAMFKLNPEEYIDKVIKLIKEMKGAMVAEHITYNQIDGSYDTDIFTVSGKNVDLAKAYKATRHIQPYVITDGTAERSNERKFAESLEAAETEVCVYAKLPKGFSIPTPVGNYSPDWAIAFYEGSVKHIYFIAETKGSMDSMHLRKIEDAKIRCAKRLFNELSTSKVKYHDVDSYQTLLNVMGSL